MNTYLTPDQLHILFNATRQDGMVAASKLYNRPGITVRAVRELFLDGYLDSQGKRYCANRKTFKALTDHGYEIEERIPEKEDHPKISEFAERVREHEKVSIDRKKILDSVLELARRKARNGSPWDWIKLQWPELVITDPTDLTYFKKFCDRTEALDLRIDDRQYDLIRHALDPYRVKEIGIKGSTSPGKGFATALLVNIWYDIYDQDRIIIIGPSHAHAKAVMFGEVSKWRRKMRHKRETELMLAEGFKDVNNEKHSLLISNPDAAESVSGLHGANTLYVLDESSNIPDEIYVSCQKPARLIIGISNPRILSGWFRSWFPSSDPDKNQIIIDRGIRRSLLTFGGPDCLNVKAKRLNDCEYAPPGGVEITDLDGKQHFVEEGHQIPIELKPHVKALIPGQMDYAKYTAIMQGRDEIVRCWSGEGKFPPEDLEFQICPPSWLKRPFEEWEKRHEEIKVTAFGLDLAYSLDGDETCLVAGSTMGIKKISRTRKADAIDTAHWVVLTAQNEHGIDLKKGGHPVAIDHTGGSSVADILERMGVLVFRIIANATAKDPRVYMNTRAELYGRFSDRINPDGAYTDVFILPPDSDLEKELEAHEKEYDREMMRFGITSKRRSPGDKRPRQTISERIGHSPDTSDAVVLCYCAIEQTAEDAFIGEQFRPGEVIQRYDELRDGTILVTLASGKSEKMNRTEFHQKWGETPPTVEAAMALYTAAMAALPSR